MQRRYAFCFRETRGSLLGMLILLVVDVAMMGSLGFSLFICPLWFLVQTARTAIWRPAWPVGLTRILAPAVVFALAIGNAWLQWGMERANASRIIAACEQFHAANGKYPAALDDLVPHYLDRVPRAKFCLAAFGGEFRYTSYPQSHTLWWGHPGH